MTFDGVYPLIAGICTKEQKEKIFASLKSDKHFWSSAGLSAVDQSAPYYRIDGYWNGTVWMAHQWFFWKTMLDFGESDFAYKIAVKALDIWKNEVETSYNCMEHFIIETGRGAGWHAFGSLSSPVVMWYSAYFLPGNFTTGFDTWIENKKFDNNNTSFSAHLSAGEDNNTTSVIACMNPNYEYEVKWNGKTISYKSLAKGTLTINILIDKIKDGKLEIHKK
jgi:Mannosylglycerate hydrolase MGH1-like glycoside hydrolase domain